MSLATVASLWLASATSAVDIVSVMVPVPAGRTNESLAVRWQQCHALSDSLRRLVCYDAMGDVFSFVPLPVAHSTAWTTITQLEAKRLSDSPAFMLHVDDEPDVMTLTRPAGQGAIWAISCANHITQVRIRLENPWSGRKVTSLLDHRQSRQDNWFVRDGGFLLESGRGLPAIDMLKSWLGYRRLELQGDGSALQLELDGLQEALKPLRQQCRW